MGDASGLRRANSTGLLAVLNAPKLTNVTEFLPSAVDGYKELVDNLVEVSLRDVARARAQIKSLLGGEIRLLPHKAGYLEVELAAELGGVIKLGSVRKRWCRGKHLVSFAVSWCGYA